MASDLEGLLLSLYDCILNTPENQRTPLADSLLKFGSKRPALLLSVSHAYLVQHNKLTDSQREFVLKSITKVIQKQNVAEQLDDQQVLLVINLATQEMTMAKEHDEDWAAAARDVLVTLAKHDRFVGHVMDALLLKFPPGLTVAPHKHVTLAMAAVAQYNAFGFVPFLTDVLSRTVPLLSHLKNDPLKSAWSKALTAFCESLIEFSSSNAQEKEEQQPTDANTYKPLITEDLQQNYADQLESAYDVVSHWVNAKDSKTRADAAECVGILCLFVSRPRLSKDLKKIVTVFLNLYRKATCPEEQYPITKGIGYFLESACLDDSLPVEYYLDDIFNSLFPHVCVVTEQCFSADESNNALPNSASIKVRNEAFRFFHIASGRFADKQVYYLLHKMQSEKDSVKLGATNLMRHLLNSAGNQMEDKRSLITMGLKPLLVDEQLAVMVKMGVCQLCVALADHGYVQPDNGGQHVVQFLMRNLVAQEDPTLPPNGIQQKSSKIHQEQTPIAQLQQQCAQALHTIAKTCESSEDLLWPYLFEFVCNDQYTQALADLFKTIRILVAKKKGKEQSLDFSNEIDTNPKLAGPLQVFVRLMVSLNQSGLSSNNYKRAKEAIKLLADMSEWISPHLTEVLKEKSSDLLESLDTMHISSTHESPRSHRHASPPQNTFEHRLSKNKKWQNLVLDLLSICIDKVTDGEWRQSLAAALGQQLRLYVIQPQDKAFAMRLLGAALSRVANPTFVTEHILLVFRTANHQNNVEREGCAQAMGHCASVHTDLVLTELENVSKWEHAKRANSSIFSFIKEAMPYGKPLDTDVIYLRATIVLSYGYVTLYCPKDMIVQRLESTTLPFLRQYLNGIKPDVPIKEAHLETMHLIASAVHPSNLNADYNFDARWECLTYIKQYVRSESPDTLSNWVRLLAAKASASLSNLEPPLSDNELWDFGSVLTQGIFPICREKSGLKTIENDETATMMDATVDQYRNAMYTIVVKKPVVYTVTQLLKIFQSFYGSQADHERARAIESSVLVLQTYANDPKDCTLGRAHDFAPLCSIIGRLAPRLADSLASVRHSAIKAIYLGFRLSLLHSGYSPSETDVLDSALFDVDEFIDKYLSDDGKQDKATIHETITAIAKEIEQRLPQAQLQTYLSVLFKMLSDRQSSVSASSARLLSIMVENRGHLLNTEAEILLKTMVEHLEQVESSMLAYPDLLEAFRLFSIHQPYTTIDVLLGQPIPYTSSCKDIWQALCKDKSHLQILFDYILETSGFPFSDSTDPITFGKIPELVKVVNTGGGTSVKNVTPQCCALTSALSEVVKNADLDEHLYARLSFSLTALLNFLVATVDTQYSAATHNDLPPSSRPKTVITPDIRKFTTTPANLIVQAIKSILTRINSTKVFEIMNAERGWSNLANAAQFPSAMATLCRTLSDEFPAIINRIIAIMVARTGNPERTEAERETVSLVLSTLVSRSPNEKGDFSLEVLKDITDVLKTSFEDTILPVRRFALRGFSYIGLLYDVCQPDGESLYNDLALTAFEAALAGLDDVDDRNDHLATEAINTLESIADVIDTLPLEQAISPLLLKLRPCFEKDCINLRAVSFSLFAKLGRRVGRLDLFRESLHSNLVIVLLHLNDESVEVQNACASVLMNLADVLSAPPAVTLIQDTFTTAQAPRNYFSFLKDFSTVMAVCFPDRVNYYAMCCCNYFKSHFPRIRCNAAKMAGFVLNALSPELKSTITKDIVFKDFADLLKDPLPEVKAAAAEGIVLLTAFD